MTALIKICFLQEIRRVEPCQEKAFLVRTKRRGLCLQPGSAGKKPCRPSRSGLYSQRRSSAQASVDLREIRAIFLDEALHGDWPPGVQCTRDLHTGGDNLWTVHGHAFRDLTPSHFDAA